MLSLIWRFVKSFKREIDFHWLRSSLLRSEKMKTFVNWHQKHCNFSCRHRNISNLCYFLAPFFYGCAITNKRKSSFDLKESSAWKTVPFAFYFVNQNEFQTSMWFVLTELVVKCGTNAEQLQLKSLKKFDFCARINDHSLTKTEKFRVWVFKSFNSLLDLH